MIQRTDIHHRKNMHGEDEYQAVVTYFDYFFGRLMAIERIESAWEVVTERSGQNAQQKQSQLVRLVAKVIWALRR